MYIHIGQDTVITDKSIIGIFDMDGTTVEKATRDFLNTAEKSGNIVYVSYELPKTFILCGDKKGVKVYISPLNVSTIEKRTEK